MQSLEKSMSQEWDVHHPNSLEPEDLLYFAYLDEFSDDWKSLYPNDDDEEGLWALEILIMSNPTGPPVIPGTGGLRKLRFGKKGEGKRGGARVCYAYFPDYHLVLMLMIYRKNEQENLTADEKQGIKKYLTITKEWLQSRDTRRTGNE